MQYHLRHKESLIVLAEEWTGGFSAFNMMYMGRARFPALGFGHSKFARFSIAPSKRTAVIVGGGTRRK